MIIILELVYHDCYQIIIGLYAFKLKYVYYSFNLYILFTFYSQTWILYLPQKSSVHSIVCNLKNGPKFNRIGHFDIHITH